MKLVKGPSPTLFPLPVVLVTVGNADNPEIITVSWTGVVNSEPPMLGVSIRPKRSTYDEINRGQEFVVNVPTASQVREVDLCGMTSSQEHDKWELCGFKPQKSHKILTPCIAECPVNIECKVEQRLELGSHHLFLGKVMAVHLAEEYLNDQGELDIAKLKPFAFTGDSYWKLGTNIGTEGFSKEAGLH